MSARAHMVHPMPGVLLGIGVLLVLVQAFVHGCYKGDPGYGLPPYEPNDGITETWTRDASRPD